LNTIAIGLVKGMTKPNPGEIKVVSYEKRTTLEDNKTIWIKLFVTQRQRLLEARDRFLDIERNEQNNGELNKRDPLTNPVGELFPL
jgi:hypothetical protein